MIKALNELKNLPILVDDEGHILFGHALEEKFPNRKKVVLPHTLKKDVVRDMFMEAEIGMLESLTMEKAHIILKEYKMVMATFEKDFSEHSLFDTPKETRLITEEIFRMPPPYNFEKHKKKQQGEEEDANLFSSIGEFVFND